MSVPRGLAGRFAPGLGMAALLLVAAWAGMGWGQSSTPPGREALSTDSGAVGTNLPGDALAHGQGMKERDEPSPPFLFLVEWFRQGGVFMWPLLLCAIIGLAIVFERFWTLTRAHVHVPTLVDRVVSAIRTGGIADGIAVCEETRGPVAAVLRAGLGRAHLGPEAAEKAIEAAGTVEMSFLQRGLVAMATVVNVAPLLGFLGTVSGMIHAFEAIAAAEQVSAKLVATGIAEALITTEAGLVIAIPIQSAMNYFISRIDRFALEMEEASVALIDALTGTKTMGSERH